MAPHGAVEIETRLAQADACFGTWRQTSFAERSTLMLKAAALLHERKQNLAALMADEMGKVLREGVAEIEKCASACEFYAANAANFFSR